jgi:NADH:ubiquinone oxidoreductase subunit D
MHAAFYRPGEVNLTSLSSFLLEDILEFSKNFFSPLSEINNLLTTNKIWKQRLINVGSYSYKQSLQYGLTGVLSRCTGLKRDLRLNKIEAYGNYYYINFRSYTGQKGDSYDRFLIRMCEMIESINIIAQLVNSLRKKKIKKKLRKLNAGFLNNYLVKSTYNKTNYKNEYISMEKLIEHFKYWTDGFKVANNFTYRAVESPKGEFGVSLFANNTNKPQV